MKSFCIKEEKSAACLQLPLHVKPASRKLKIHLRSLSQHKTCLVQTLQTAAIIEVPCRRPGELRKPPRPRGEKLDIGSSQSLDSPFLQKRQGTSSFVQPSDSAETI